MENRNASNNKGVKGKPPTQEQVVNGFNELRQQQRQLIAKISEITDERKEYQLVVDTLKDMESERRCYRMVGGVLVERTVGEITPALLSNIEQMTKLLESLEQQVEKKGRELQEYREKHNIKVQGEKAATEASKTDDSKSAAGVLVSS